MSDSLRVAPAPALGRVWPSGRQANDRDASGLSLSVRISFPLAVSQTLMVLSALPLPSTCPSGLQASDVTSPVWLRVVRNAPLLASHNLIVPSQLPLPTLVLSLLQANAVPPAAGFGVESH